ncbi:hypothetical protein, partial [Pseudomonas savastanoi]
SEKLIWLMGGSDQVVRRFSHNRDLFGDSLKGCSPNDSLTLQFAAIPETVAIVPSIGYLRWILLNRLHGSGFTTHFN